MSLIEELKDIVTLSKEAGISLSDATTLYKSYKKQDINKENIPAN